MKWPDELNLCKNCSGTVLTPWFKNKLEEFVDMDYPYSYFRPSLLVCARRDLCPDCAKKVIECVDRLNNWSEQADESASCVMRKGCTWSSINQTANVIDISVRRIERIIDDA